MSERAAAHLHGFVSALGADPSKRMDFLRAVAEATPPDVERM